ncbi:hypothetical protein [Actinomadura litoris]|uniref:Uncharacterized protein n=1 Tax=Actinomadura litoris TaxID=2678616 RepID=A0A7K1L7J3_9ACTN|nr:hypothetical protein [Actinomadura litoris]MUN40411.1 hypothetical protein [Actinomadura litoris]
MIDPNAIPIPKANVEGVEAAGRALKTDGEAVAGTGHDIDSGWQALDPHYNAPEEQLLLSATHPVAANGDAFKGEVTTVGDALISFAGEIRPIIGRLQTLKGNAQAFRNKIEDDGDWRKDGDKVDEHNKLNNDVLAAVAQYQAAERTCANKITGVFGGTRFIAADGKPGSGEKAYGMGQAPKNVETPWAKPQKEDKPWYKDGWDAAKGWAKGLVTGLADLVGLHGENGWVWEGDSHFWSNLGNGWMGKLEEISGLVGLHGENGWVWEGDSHFWDNLGTNWKETAHSLVPWREWDDRPGFVITTAAINVGTVGVGAVAKKLLGRRGGGGDGDGDGGSRPGDRDGDGRIDSDADLPSNGRDPDLDATAGDLRRQLDDLDIDSGDLGDLQRSMDDAESLPDREPAHVGGDDDPPGSGGDHGDPGGDGPGRPEGETTPDGGDGKPDGNDGNDGNPDANGKPDGDGAPNGEGKPDSEGKPDGDGAPNGEGKPDGDGRPDDDGRPDPDHEKKIKKADEAEASLRRGGLSDEDIERLRGDNPRDGDQWQRLASALNQKFSKRALQADPNLHHDALRWAMEGAENPREVAYRYEYYKAHYDQMKRDVDAARAAQEIPPTDQRSSLAIASERFRRLDLDALLERDIQEVRATRPNADQARLDPSLGDAAREAAVRRQAGDIGMGDDSSAAYHVRKHLHELPRGERGGDAVHAYMNSAERTIRDGDLVIRSVGDDGTETMVFVRNVAQAGEPKKYVEALIKVRPDGRIVMPTYSKAKIFKGEV